MTVYECVKSSFQYNTISFLIIRATKTLIYCHGIRHRGKPQI